MSESWDHAAIRSALLAVARDRSSLEELRCHALFELVETRDRLRRALRDALARSSLTEAGFYVLAHLVHGDAGGVDGRFLADRLGVSRQMISAILGRLEVSGLITREQLRGKQRVLAIAVTTAGRTAFSSAIDSYFEAIEQVMSVLDTSALTDLDRTCAQLRLSASESAVFKVD